MVLVGTLVTAEAPRTVKLARSAPSIGVANACDGPRASATSNGSVNFMVFISLLLVDPCFERYRTEPVIICALADISVCAQSLGIERIERAMTGHSPSIQALGNAKRVARAQSASLSDKGGPAPPAHRMPSRRTQPPDCGRTLAH